MPYPVVVLLIGLGTVLGMILILRVHAFLALIAAELGVDLGLMMLVGGFIAVPTAAVGLVGARVLSRLIDIPMRPIGDAPEPEPLDDAHLPPLWLALAPVVLPVVLISANTAAQAWAGIPALEAVGENAVAEVDGTGADGAEFDNATVDGAEPAPSTARRIANVTAVTGNPNLALLLAAVVAMVMLARHRRLTLVELARSTETALMSGGVIILITAGGGAFGAMLRETGIETTLRDTFAGGGEGAGMVLLPLGFAVAALLKVAQGSGTVSMMVAASIMASFGATPDVLGCHPVYLATAIGSGSVVGSWMNDSGFWIFARMSGLTELETLKTWTLELVLLGATGLALTLLLARLMPLA